jgi:predicted transcriptional regulator
MDNKEGKHLMNVQVDLYTNELFKYLKDTEGTNSMYEAVQKFIEKHLTEDELKEVQRRFDAKMKYRKLSQQHRKPSD